ncbi:MAG: phage Gp37/Gp68 family protein [Dehalococcoidia bacterium]|nr:phage Gp37/Gp68 family protein [Dehalococcoidia bacterium]
MADRSAIEWTDATWNPVTGCTKISPACAHCYAEAITLRFGGSGPFLPGRGVISLHPERLSIPVKWRAPRRIFVNSMGDLFHEDVPLKFIERVFEVMASASRHTFQILTKRHLRLRELSPFLDWPPNVWIGVSVENQYWAERRIPALLRVPARIRFLSVEPLLKPVDLSPYLVGLQWVIVGGESGPKARPMHPDWVSSVRQDCEKAGIPFFFKQWGGRTSKAGGRLLDGRSHDGIPTVGGALGHTSIHPTSKRCAVALPASPYIVAASAGG